MSYPTGSVKQNPADLSVAVRTAHADEDLSWGVMTLNHGGHYCGDDDVADWPDLVPA